MADNEAKLETIDKILSANAGNEEAFPRTVAKGVWEKVMKGSVIQGLSGSIPVSLNGTAIPVPVGQPVAGIVSEGETKPVGTLETKVKTMEPVKAALIVIYSMEAAKADPLGEYGRIQAALAEGVARTIDTAVITGKDALTGAVLEGKESLASAANVVEVDLTDESAGYLARQIGDAYDAVTLYDEGDYEFTQLMLGREWRSPLIGAVDAGGNRLYTSGSLNQNVSQVLGLDTTFTQAVHGWGAAKDASVLGFGGDFKDAVKFGYVENITFRRASERAGGIDLFDRNLGAILCEAQFGWVVRDTNAFAKFVSAAA